MKKFLLILFSGLLFFVFNSNAQQLNDVTTDVPISITPTSATLNGFVETTGGAIDVNYQFNYGTGGTLDLATTSILIQDLDGSQSVNQAIGGSPGDAGALTPATEYSYNLYAIDTDNNELTSSPNATFWTLATEPDDAGTPAFVSSDFDEVSISFDAATDADGYLILYKLGPAAPAVTGVEDGTIGTGFADADGFLYVQDDATTTRTVTIESLMDQEEYSFRVIPFAHDGGDPAQEETYNYKTDGTATISSVYTLSPIHQTEIDNFVIGATTNSSIQIDWDDPGNTIGYDGYILLYAEGGSAPDPDGIITKGVLPENQGYANQVVVNSVNDGGVLINTGLNAGTQYSFSIVPYNNDGDQTPETTNYNLTDYATTSGYTLATEPIEDPASQAIGNRTVDEISISYGQVNSANGYLILWKENSAIAPNTTGVEDGTKSTDGSEFTDADGYEYIDGSASISPTISLPTVGTEYSFRIIPYSYIEDGGNNEIVETYNYRTPGVELLSGFTLSAQPTQPVSDLPVGENKFTDSIYFTIDPYTFPDNGGFLLYYTEGDSPQDLTDLTNGDRPESQIAGANLVFEPDDAETEIGIGSLSAGTQYSFILPIYNTNGNDDETFHYLKSGAPTATHWTLAEEPTTDPGAAEVINISESSITISYGEVATANGYLILYRANTNAPNDVGVEDGIEHSLASEFTEATGFQYVNKSGNSTEIVEITGLDAAEIYSFRILPYSYVEDAGNPVVETYNYKLGGRILENETSAAARPTEPVSNFSAIDIQDDRIEFQWDDYDADPGFPNNGGFWIFEEEYDDGDIDLTNLVNGEVEGGQTGIPDLFQITDDAATTSTPFTNLSPATRYTFSIIPYNFEGGTENISFRRAGRPTVSYYTLAEPAHNGEDVTNLSIEDFNSSSIDLSWDAVTGAGGYLVVFQEGNTDIDLSDLQNGIEPDAQNINSGTTQVVDVGTNSATLEDNVGGVEINPDTEYAIHVIPYTFGEDASLDPIPETYNYNKANPLLVSEKTLCIDPVDKVTGLDTNNIDINQMDVSWSNASGLPVLVVARLSGITQAPAVDGTEYTANSDFSAANEIGTSDNFVVYEGFDATFTLTGLEDFQEYSIDVYVFNDNGFCYENVGETVTETTLCDPATTEVNNTSISVNAFDEITLNWTIVGSGNNVLIVAREDGTVAEIPSSNVDYSENSEFESGQELGTGNYAVYDGNGTSVTVNGLDPLTNYHFDIYEYNPTRGGFCYNTTAVTLSETTVCEPPESEAIFDAPANVTAATVDLSWPAVTGADRYLIVAKEGSAVDLTVNNGDDFEDGGTGDIPTSSFLAAADGDGTSGNKIVYANEGTSVTITELSGSTQYYFSIYAYKSGTYCYDFASVSIDITTDPVEASNTLTYNSAATTISSVGNDASASFITVMDFDMSDLGDDAADTKISGFTFTAGTSDDFDGSFLWDDIIADARVVNNTNNGGSGLVKAAVISTTDNEISVSLANNENNNNGQFGFIGDGSSINMELQIRLKESISVTEIDLKNLAFALDPNNITIRSGSEFNTFVSEISTLATENEIEVNASEFEFTTNPSSPLDAGENVTPRPVVEAKDENGNLDLDYSTNFTITSAVVTENLPTTFTNGEMQFPVNFNYQGSGDGTLTITDNAPGNFSAQSDAVTVNPTVTLTEETGGLNTGTLQSGSTEQAVLGFSIDALGSSQMQEIVFSTNIDLNNVVNNVKIVESTNNSIYDGTGDDGIIATSPTIDNGANTITFTGLTQDFDAVTPTRTYFLILDVDESVNEFDNNTDLEIGLNMANIVFDNTANTIANDFSQTYGFEDIIDPLVDQVTATPTLLSGSDLGTSALAIEITFTEEMDPVFIPAISFPTFGENPGASLVGPEGSSAWSPGNMVYTAYYELTDQDVLIENIDVLIADAKDKSGNDLADDTENDLFTIDTENPKADPITLDVASINRPNNTIEIEITFDKVMNNSIDPDFSFNSTTEMSNNGDGEWSVGNTVYTVTFDHSLEEEEVSIANIDITNAQDAAGNIMEPATSGNFAINTVQPRIDNISATNSNGIYKENDNIDILVSFDEDVLVTNNPKLELNSGGEATYLSKSSNVITFRYTVGAGENVVPLDVDIFDLNGAEITNTAGNDAILTLPGDPNRLQDNRDIEIDTRSPEVASISLDLNTVSQTENILEVIVEYDEDMDQSSTPSFSFSEGSNLSITGGGWLDALNYRVEFTHNLNEEDRTNVTIEVSGATDVVGNTTVTADSDPFDIDTQSPRITEIISNTPNGTYGPGEQVNIRVIFDEAIQQTGTAPTLTLNTGATAVFDNITGVNQDQLNFTYTIGAVNSNENTLDLDVTSISTSENEVLDLVDNPSVLTLPASPNRLIDNSEIVIDTRPAEITNVTATNDDGKYKEGDIILITVTFDEIVTVSDNPIIVLNTGDFAEYVSGSNSNELTFKYEIQNSDGINLFDVADLEYEDVNSLELNGGTIVDPASVPVDQTLPTIGDGNSLGDNKNIEIDTRQPEFTIDLDISMVDLNDLTLTITTEYDEDMDTNSDPSYSFSQANNLIQDNVGDWINNRTYVETFTHDETEENLQNITVEITGATDEVGNVAITNISSQFDIDTQKPRITEINSTSSGIYGPGETIDIKVTFDEDIQQTGPPPTLNLNTGGTATFDNRTNGNELNFTYTIGAVNSGQNTPDLNVTSVSNSENDVLDLQENPSVLSLPGGNNLADNGTIIIDTDPADVTDVTANPTTGIFKAGEEIDIIITFNETVVVDDTGGKPRLLLNTGSYAIYSSGSNSDELTFTYTVASADGTLVDVPDLEYADVNSLELNGGTIVDLASVDVNLELPATGASGSLGDNTDIEIDTTSPTVTIDLDNTEITRANNQLVLTAEYNEDMDTNSEPSFAFNVANNLIQDNAGNWTDNRTYVETFSHNLTEEELENVNIEITGATDVVGNIAITNTSENLIIDTQKPRLTEIVSTTSDGLYGPSDNINIRLVFDEDVEVTGIPELDLNSNGIATYQNITNGKEVNFIYTVGAINSGENAMDLDVDQFNMEGGAIKDLVDNDAEIVLPSDPDRLQDNSDIEIDTRSPEILTATVDNSVVSQIVPILNLTVEFDEDMDQGSTPSFNFSAGNNIGLNSGEWTGARIYVVEFEHDLLLEEELDNLNIEVSGATDVVGNVQISGDSETFDVDTQSPRITEILSTTADAIYGPDDQINIKVIFDEEIQQTGTAPELTLNTGATAVFDNITNGNELNFIYTVGATSSGENTSDLNVVGISGSENEVLDLVDNPSVLDLPGNPNRLSDNSDLIIDTSSPTVTIDLDNTEITRANNQLVLTAEYSEEMDTNTEPSFAFNVANNLIQDNVGSWTDNRTYVETFTHDPTEEELEAVNIEVSGGTDVVGNTAITNTSINFIIDTQKPRVLEIVSTSDDGLYSPGDDINIQFIFDEDVVVSGTPNLDLNSGATASASFQNVTNGNEVNFIYTVGAVGSDENTPDLDVEQFNMNGGAIKDLVENDAEIELPSDPNRLQDNADIQVDTDPANIANVTALTPDGFYTIGDVIEISIKFNEPTFVTGTPLLELNTGDVASYASGSESTILIFNYVVQAADDIDLFDVSDLNYNDINSIELNGGTIRDQAGINATITLPATGSPNSLGENKEITIDTKDPEMANDPFTPFNGEFNVSQSLTFTIEMNEPVTGQGTENISLIDNKTGNVVAVFDGENAFNNSDSTILVFDSFQNLFQDSTEYYIQFEQGALVDRAGNQFEGFSADNVWSFTTFGPPRIDDFSIGACVGEVFTIQGQYFTGVSRIRTNIDGNNPFTILNFTVIDDENIEFTVPAGTVPGTITLDKQIGEAGNTANASTTSKEDIKVGPSKASLVLVDSNDAAICDIDELGNENQVEFGVEIVGGTGLYTLVYQINSNEPDTIRGFEDGQTFTIIPPDSAENNVSILSFTDEDEDLNTCSAPNLGTDVEVIKFISSRVDAGGFSENEDDTGVIELCGANSNIVDFSDESVVINSPQINGTIEQGIWTIDEGPSANGGGFSPDFSLKSVQTDRPDTVKYYASFADGVRGSVVLKLTSDDPDGLNPCSGTFDLVSVEFVESISVLTERNLSLCIEEDENGNEFAIADLFSSVSGGLATDSLTVEWTRIDEFNEDNDYDSTWGFKDDEDQAKFALTSSVLNPIYKASPQEVEEGRSTLEAAPVLFSGVGCGATNTSREINIRINDIPTLTKSDGPEIVCSGEQEVKFRMDPSKSGNTFVWNFINNLNVFDGDTTSNLVFVNFREVQTATTDTLVVQEFDPSTGCESKRDTFFITLKPLPIAKIKDPETTTIPNTSAAIELIGGVLEAGNLIEATSENGQFTGRGVVQNSEGNYFLDPSKLDFDKPSHEVIFTFADEFGCSATDTISFRVYNADNIFIGLSRVYCEEDAADTIRVDEDAVVPDGFSVIGIRGPGITPVNPVMDTDGTLVFDEAIFDPKTAYQENGDQSNVSLTYSIQSISDPDNILEQQGPQPVTVNPLPDFDIEPIEPSICTDDETIELEPLNLGDDFSFRLLNTNLSETLISRLLIINQQEYEFDPEPLLEHLSEIEKDSIRIFIEYSFRDANSCENSKEYDFLVWKQPSKPTLESTELCLTESGPETAVVNNYFDDFEEQELKWYSSTDFSLDAIGEGKTFTPDTELFVGNNADSATFYVVRTNASSEGEANQTCASDFTTVTYRRINSPDFYWNTSIFGEDGITFTANPNQENIDEYHWKITKLDSDGSENLEPEFEGSSDTPVLSFIPSGAGRYKVILSTSSTFGCESDSFFDEMVLLPKAESYSFDFNTSSQGWISSGRSSSINDWEYAKPDENSSISAADSLWVTKAAGAYTSGIQSYVYSPAFDISDISRPVVSFDLWLDALSDDGLVLEYSTDTLLIENSQKQWQLLGSGANDESSGLNWYNASDISSQPGTANEGSNGEIQLNNPSSFGWSNLVNWRNAVHSLDQIQGNGEFVVFRFQFKTRAAADGVNEDNPEGVAFDNFKIESLNRNVLVEYFGDYTSDRDTVEMNAINNEFKTAGNFAWINYRINENDPLYKLQSSSMFSRIYYYDAYEFEDQFAIDGVPRTEFTFSENDGDAGANDLSRARLFSSIISRIDLDVSLVNEDELEIDVSFESIEPLDDNVNLYIAVLQKEISGGDQGTDSTKIYYNVLRKLLPTNSGIAVSGTSGEHSVNFKASRESDEEPLAVVAFLQNVDNGQVIQSAYIDGFDKLTYSNVTSIDKALNALDIRLYPNPAHDNLNIQWDIPLHEEAKVKVIDVTGKIIKDFRLEKGQRYYELNTSAMKTGMYNLILTNQKGEHKIMKFAVTN